MSNLPAPYISSAWPLVDANGNFVDGVRAKWTSPPRSSSLEPTISAADSAPPEKSAEAEVEMSDFEKSAVRYEQHLADKRLTAKVKRPYQSWRQKETHEKMNKIASERTVRSRYKNELHRGHYTPGNRTIHHHHLGDILSLEDGD